MLLRIEDTDRERSTAAAIAAIIDGLTWLGLTWDGEIGLPVLARRAPPRDRRAAARRRQGLSLLRLARGAHRHARGGARARAAPSSMTAAGATAIRPRRRPGVKPVIRLKAPQTGETVIEDQVQGRVVWQNADLDDLVLLRSDGTPTYMLAVVVDDHDMDITHIIRGDDHLTNGARQKQIYDALGWNVPIDGAYPADPRAGRLQAVQAPRRARRRRLSRHGLPAGGDAQLSGAARLGAWRPGDLHHRGDDRGLRSAGDRPLAGALRFRQARKPQRPLHPRQRRRRPGRRARAAAAAYRRRRRSWPAS